MTPPVDDQPRPALSHVFLTRFNLPTQGAESLVRAREGWLRDRWELFNRFTVPSMEQQTVRNFGWLIYFDSASPGWLLDGIAQHQERGLFRPLFRESVDTPELLADLRDLVGEQVGGDLLTTNIDNDDGLAADFVARVQAAPVSGPTTAIYLSTGLIRSQAGVYLRRDRRNAFCSVRSSWDEPVTCWQDWHNRLGRHMPVVEIAGAPGWLQVIHGANVSNRVRGRLITPAGLRSRFPGLLDDIPTPGPGDLLADGLVRYPLRVSRDAVRMGTRRALVRVLGKDGLNVLKDRLARLSRPTG